MTGRTRWLLFLIATMLVVGAACSPPEPEPEPDCTNDGDCEVGSICEDGTCESAICPDVYDPVCGVNGETYGNACEARAAHVEVAYEGECKDEPQVCGGIQGLSCPEGEMCDLQPGLCGGADLDGVCVEKPEICPEVYDPVCGCDGVTYSNDCFRLMAGEQKDHDGECG